MDNSALPQIDAISVIKRDYQVSLFLLSPLALWAAVLIKNMGGGSITSYLVFAIVGTVILSGIGLARIGNITGLAAKGTAVTAEVKQIIAGKNKGRIHYRYRYDGQTYEGIQVYRAREPVKRVKKGLQVVIAVDPAKPQKSVIPVLFQDSNPFLEDSSK